MKTKIMLARRTGLVVWMVCQTAIAVMAQLSGTGESSNIAWRGFYDDKHLAHIKTVTQPSIEKEFRQIMSYLTPTEQAKLGKVMLVFPPEDGKHPMNFHAEIFKEKKTIVLPQSALRFLNDLCLAYAYLNRHEMNEGVLSEYLSIIRYQWPAIKNKPYRPLDALGIDRKKALADKDVDSLFGKLYSTAIWFIIYHELGHLLYQHPGNHIPDKEESRRNETQADQFALTLLHRVGDPPFGGIVTFFWITQHFTPFVEKDKNFRDKATHPLTASRLRMVADSLSKNAAWYARKQSNPERFTKLFQATADEIRLMGDKLANGKFWGLTQAMGQAGNIEQLNVHRPRPSIVVATSSKDPFAGSFSGYWSNKKNGLMLMQLHLYRQQGQIKGTGLIIDPESSRHSIEVQWQITTGEVDKETLYFAWQMGNHNVGTGKLKRTKSGLSGLWETTQKGETKKLGNLVLTRTQ